MKSFIDFFLSYENQYEYIHFKSNIKKFIIEDKFGLKYFRKKKNKIFCLNAGSCGSMYIVRLLSTNLIENCYHQKFPEMNKFGIKLFEKKNLKIPWYFKLTRRHVFFESSNRLFSFTNFLNENYQSKFIHLFRNPFKLFDSSIRKKNFYLNFKNKNHLRYGSVKLCGAINENALIRAANYWLNINNKIFEDLKYINNKNKLWINCQNLFHGKIGNLEKFIGFELKTKKIEKINTKDNLIDEQIPYLDTKSILYNENKNLYDKINNLYSKLKEKEKKIII